MRLTVDPALPDPPYAQIRAQVHAQMRDGTLVPGTRLPPVRTLAAELGLAANTVARAYRELEALGVIETRGRAGSFVSGDQVARAAGAAAAAYVATLRDLGRDRADALALVERAWDLAVSAP